jgi:hypothetical protein
MSNLVAAGLTHIHQQLSDFAKSTSFWQSFDGVFGSQYDKSTAQMFQLQWQNQDFGLFPMIEVVSGEVLGNARGAYAASNDTIYLADRFLLTASTDEIDAVLLEEFGHFIDDRINRWDTAGDEGQFFAAVVRQDPLNAQSIAALRSENDGAWITLGGRSIAVEQSNYNGTNLDQTIAGVEQLLDKLQNTLNSRIFANQLPLLGNSLQSSTNTAVQFIQGFKTNILNKLHEKLDSATAKTPDLVRNALFEALGPGGLNILQNNDANSAISAADIVISDLPDNVSFDLKLKALGTANHFTSALDGKIGLLRSCTILKKGLTR